MSTPRIMRGAAWLLAGCFAVTAACGSSDDGDDDDDLPATGTTSSASGGLTTNASSSGSGTSGGNNFNNNNASSTTGDMLDRDNDNCDGIEAEAGEPCPEDGLNCLDADGRMCLCGGRGDEPDGIWSCRGQIDSAGGAAGAPGSGGAAGAAGAGGEAGENQGGADAD